MQTYFDLAISLAETAYSQLEVPVGALILNPAGELLSSAYNQKESQHNPCAHAEILAIQQATAVVGNWRLTGCTLISTLEPCCMCAGALLHARISKAIIGALDPKFGACGSLFSLHQDPRLNHRFVVEQDPDLAQRSAALLKQFFKERRSKA